MSERVLVVEDDRGLGQALAGALVGAGFRVAVVKDGMAAMRSLREDEWDVVLLDIGLPFVNGWRILESHDGGERPPFIIISARGDEQDKVRALDMGADDYLAKPFGAPELIARVRAVLRRARPAEEPAGVVHWGPVSIDLGERAVFRDEVEVKLSPTEYRLVAELARHAHEVCSHRSLLQTVWGSEYADERQYLRTFMQRLRQKLERDPAKPEVLQSIPGRGYRFGPALPR